MKGQNVKIANVNGAEPLRYKLDALEWLLPKVRLQHEEQWTEIGRSAKYRGSAFPKVQRILFA